MPQPSYVYILASERNGTLYIGVTTDLVKRCYEHKNGTFKGFTSRYKVYRFVHYEVFEDVINAIAREKALKKWSRAWKLELIEKSNPEWRDLYSEIIQ
jgi:putative endonuclease